MPTKERLHARRTPVSPRNRKSAPTRSAFTLVELLVVVAIVGILAGLVFTAIGSARKSALRASGASALRQTGAAILLFTQENQNTLPGPLWPGQVPYYAQNEQERLSYWLAPYLDVPENAEDGYLVEALAPPAFPLEEFGAEPRTFVVNTELEAINSSSTFNPWGDQPELADGPSDSSPSKIFAVDQPEKTWAVMDADQQHPSVKGKPWSSSTPAEPIHNGVRLTLFFDGHVEARSVDAEL